MKTFIKSPTVVFAVCLLVTFSTFYYAKNFVTHARDALFNQDMNSRIHNVQTKLETYNRTQDFLVASSSVFNLLNEVKFKTLFERLNENNELHFLKEVGVFMPTDEGFEGTLYDIKSQDVNKPKILENEQWGVLINNALSQNNQISILGKALMGEEISPNFLSVVEPLNGNTQGVVVTTLSLRELFKQEHGEGKGPSLLNVHYDSHTNTMPIYEESSIAKGLAAVQQIQIGDVRLKMVFRHNDNLPLQFDSTIPYFVLVLGVALSFIARQFVTGLYRKHDELVESKKVAEDASIMKSEFLANMSHEIRTPMNGIIGMAEILTNSDMDERLKIYSRTILNSGENLLEIINDILDFSKIEAGSLKIEPIEIDLQKVVEDIGDLYRPKAIEKGVELLVRLTPKTQRHVMGDEVRIKQVIGNFVSNAIKFTSKGLVLLHVEQVGGHKEGGQVRVLFKVKDTGIGIAPDVQKRVFDRFTQADSSTTRKFGGTGLGLSICQQLVGLMGGKIGLNSTPGEGSTFWFELPLPVCENMKEHQPQNRYDFSGKNVLIVSKYEELSSTISDTLSIYNCACKCTTSVQVAYQLMIDASVAGNGFDTMLVEESIDGVKSDDLMKKIKMNLDDSAMRFVLIGDESDLEKFHELEKRGFSGILTRPIHKSELLILMNRILLENVKSAQPLTKAVAPKAQVKLVEPHSEQAEVPNVSNQPNEQGQFHGVSILVVEDNLVNQMLIKEVLQNLGCQVTFANNGEEGLKELLASECQFDLVFMDCQMPIMDGYAASRYIHELKDEGRIRSNLPVIALTANALKQDVERCFDAGMDDHIPKPIKQQDVVNALSKWKEEFLSAPQPKVSMDEPLNLPLNTGNVTISLNANHLEGVPNEVESSNLTSEVKELLEPQHLKEDLSGNVDDLVNFQILSDLKNVVPNSIFDVIHCYIETSDAYMDELMSSLRSADIERILRICHNMRSTSHQLGAEFLSQKAGDVEKLSKEVLSGASAMNESDFERGIRNVQHIYGQTKNIFESWLSEEIH